MLSRNILVVALRAPVDFTHDEFITVQLAASECGLWVAEFIEEAALEYFAGLKNKIVGLE